MEWMRHFLQLSNFSLASGGKLMDWNGSAFTGSEENDDENWKFITFNNRIEEYVVQGNRHPRLPDNQPDSASAE